MFEMFQYCERLVNLDLSSFDTRNVTNMGYMFNKCKSLRSINLHKFNTQNVTFMRAMFNDCQQLQKLNLCSFDTRNVTDMDLMFNNDGNLETIYVTSGFVAPVASEMFKNCNNLVGGEGTEFSTEQVDNSTYAIIDGEDGNLGYFSKFFYSLNYDWTGDNNWDTLGEVGNYSTIKKASITEINIVRYPDEPPNNPILKWNMPDSNGLVGYVYDNYKVMIYAEYSVEIYVDANASNLFSSMTYADRTFKSVSAINNLDVLNTSKVTNMRRMFYNMRSLSESIDLSNFDTSNVRDMSSMFQNCASIETIDIKHFDTGNVESFSSMFNGCTSLLSIDISNLDTRSVMEMPDMFANCESLTTATLSNLDNSFLIDISGLFMNCTSLTSVDFSFFNTERLRRMDGAFQNCISLTELNLKDFNTKEVSQMNRLFYGDENLETIYVSRNWSTASISSILGHIGGGAEEVFTDCVSLVGENGTTIDDIADDTNYIIAESALGARVDEGLDSFNPGYLTLYRYTFAPTWFDTAPDDYFKADIFSIKFLTFHDEEPEDYIDSFILKDSGGLVGYILINESIVDADYCDVLVYPPQDCDIKLAVDSSYVFSDIDSSNTFTALSTISNFNYLYTVKTKNMSHMFDGAGLTSFYGTFLDTSNASDLSYMFANMPNAEKIDIKTFDIQNVENMSYMFYNSGNLQEISFGRVNSTNVQTMAHMFDGCVNLGEIDLSKFDTSNVSEMGYMFKSCSQLKRILVYSSFVTTNLTDDGIDMFDGCINLEGSNETRYSEKINIDPSNAKDKTYACIDGDSNNEGYLSLKCYTLSLWWAGSVNTRIYEYEDVGEDRCLVASISFLQFPESAPTSYLYKWILPDSDGLEGYVVENPADSTLRDVIIYAPDESTIYSAKNAPFLFADFKFVKEIRNLNYLDTSKTSNMASMFRSMRELRYLDLSNFDTRNATNMQEMFYECFNLQALDLSTFDTSKVIRMNRMFYYCRSLETLDLSSFDTSNVRDMAKMFQGCSNIQTLDLSMFDTSEVTDMTSMFEEMSALTKIDVSSFNTNNVEHFEAMFKGLLNIQELYLQSFSSNRQNLTSNQMFFNCIELETIYVARDFPIFDESSSSMFAYCDSLVGEKGTRCAEFGDYARYARIDGGTSNEGYFTLHTYHIDPEWTGDNESEFIGIAENISTYRKDSITEINIAAFTDAVPSNVNWTWRIPDSGGLIGYVYDSNKVMIHIPHDCDVKIATDSSFLFSSRLSGNAFKFTNALQINNLNYFKAVNVQSMKGMFEGMKNLGAINLSNFDVASVSDMSKMFNGCEKLTSLDLRTFDTKSLINITETFADCKDLITIYVTPQFKITNIPAANRIDTFRNCEKLTGVGGTNLASSNVSDGSYAVIDAGPRSIRPGYFTYNYVFVPGWLDNARDETNILVFRNNTREITFSKYNETVPTNYIGIFNVPNSNGLIGYVYDAGTQGLDTYYSINIHAPENYLILTAENSTGLFGSSTAGFSKLTAINNIDYLDTSKTTNMSYMFSWCGAIQSLNLKFDTSNVTNMRCMFEHFGNNQNADISINLKSFDTRKVTDMSHMFTWSSHLKTVDLSSFDTSNVSDMKEMFKDCENLTTIYAGTNFVLNSLLDGNDEKMFLRCVNLVGSNGTSYQEILASRGVLYAMRKEYARIDGVNGKKGYFSKGKYIFPKNWAIGNPTYNVDERYVHNSHILRASISTISFTRKPALAPAYYEYIYTWDIEGSLGLTGYIIPSNDGVHYEIVIHADTSTEIYLEENSSYLFSSIPEKDGAYSNLQAINNLNYLNTSNVISFQGFFYNLSSIESINLSSINTSNATTLSMMFAGCRSLNSIDVSSFRTSNVTDLSYTFQHCESITELNLDNFNTSNVTDFSYTFQHCSSITDLNLRNFNTSKATSMRYMFSEMLSLPNIYLRSFDTSNVTDMEGMFYRMPSLEYLVTIDYFDTSNVTNMKNMFSGMTQVETLDLYNFDTSNVLNMDFMFSHNTNLRKIYVSPYKWSINSLTTGISMFEECNNLVGSEGTSYVNMRTSDPVNCDNINYAHIDKVSNPGYFSSMVWWVLAELKANGGIFSNGYDRKGTYIVDGDETSIFEEPTRLGYKFKEYIVNGQPLTPLWRYGVESRDVIATWIPNNYKIIYRSNGGTGSMDVDIATYNTIYKVKENKFTRDGYEFDGFKYNDVLYNKNDEVINLTSIDNGEVIFNATWKAKTYTINYFANGGTGEMPSETVTYGTDHTISTISFTRDGYIFAGWALSGNANVSYGDKSVIFGTDSYREVINLYAKWIRDESVTGTLVLLGNGGYINGLSTYTMQYGQGDIISDVSKSRDGYEFVGWTDESGVDVMLPTTCDFIGTKTFKANWNELKYKLVYHANNGSSEIFVEEVPQATTSHIVKTIASLGWMKEYHSFSGWSLESDDSNIVMTDGGDIGFVDVVRVDYYAVWTPYTYTINLRNWNPLAAAGARDKAETFVYGENKRIATIATRSYLSGTTEYLFSGWAASSTTSVKYFDNYFADRIYEAEGGESNGALIYLDSLWREKQSSVNLMFDANGGMINGKRIISITLSNGDTIPYPNPTKDLYKKSCSFVGWYEADMVTPFTAATVNFNEAKIVYASWSESSYTIKYVSHDKDISSPIMNQETRRCYEEFNLTANSFKRLGYKFIGWDTKEDAKNVIYKDRARVSELADANGEVTLYAVWEEKVYTIKFYDCNRTYQNSTTFTYNGYTLILQSNIPLGKIDAGYKYTSENIEKTFYSGQRVSKNDFVILEESEVFNLYSSVIDKIYTVTFDAGDGTFDDGTKIKTAKIKYMEKIIFPNAKYRNLNFKTWQVNNVDFIGSKYLFDDDVTFKATFEERRSGGGGTGGSGGGGGGGSGGPSNQVPIIPVTYINQVKFINAILDSERVSWHYDPISNSFKLNTDKNNETPVALNGFYLINNMAYNISGGNLNNVPTTETYYFDEFGTMITGWIHTIDNKWYYCEAEKNKREGQMVFGWYKVQGKWYYFAPDGSMLINTITPDGYLVGADGSWVE